MLAPDHYFYHNINAEYAVNNQHKIPVIKGMYTKSSYFLDKIQLDLFNNASG